MFVTLKELDSFFFPLWRPLLFVLLETCTQLISFSQCFNFCQNFPLHVFLSLKPIKEVHKGAGQYESTFSPGLTAVKKYIPTLNLFVLSKLRPSPSLPCTNTGDDFPVDNFWPIFKAPCTRQLIQITLVQLL
jgi:hypothetical protein